MLNEGQRRRIQAQLVNLGHYSDGLDLRTNGLDGNWGALPQNANSVSNTRGAIHSFKEANNLLSHIAGQSFNPQNYDISEEDEELLNQQAPYNFINKNDGYE